MLRFWIKQRSLMQNYAKKPYGSKLKPCRNIYGPERSLISCFYVDIRVVWSENVRFFLLRPSFKKSCWEGKRSLWFVGAIIFCQLLLDLPGFLFFEVSVASCFSSFALWMLRLQMYHFEREITKVKMIGNRSSFVLCCRLLGSCHWTWLPCLLFLAWWISFGCRYCVTVNKSKLRFWLCEKPFQADQ